MLYTEVIKLRNLSCIETLIKQIVEIRTINTKLSQNCTILYTLAGLYMHVLIILPLYILKISSSKL